MQRRKFSREFKIEAFRLVGERGVSVAQASRDIDVHENVLRKWVRDLGADPKQAFPGHGQMKPEQLEIDRDRGEADRARAVLLTLAGWTSSKIAEAFGVREDTVRLWRSDFTAGGVAALKTSIAPGPPR